MTGDPACSRLDVDPDFSVAVATGTDASGDTGDWEASTAHGRLAFTPYVTMPSKHSSRFNIAPNNSG